MADFNAIGEAIKTGNRAEAVKLVEAALAEGANPVDILNKGVTPGMRQAGELFNKNEIFVPELLIAARAMYAATEKLPKNMKPKGTVVTGTVKGDLHDIGKNLVCIMVRGAGYKVIDVGVDCSAEKFIGAAKENSAQAILCSALLTTTMPYMKTVVDEVKAAKLPCKVVIGGAPVTQAFAEKIGADGYGADAYEAVLVADKLIGAA
jgi:5-methyltetrahydrofolate--homocysteine methyltransferase